MSSEKIPGDEGPIEIKISVNFQRQLVKISFEKPITWLSFSPEEALGFCKLISDRVKELTSAGPPN